MHSNLSYIKETLPWYCICLLWPLGSLLQISFSSNCLLSFTAQCRALVASCCFIEIILILSLYPVSTCCPYFALPFQVKIGHQWLFLKALSSFACLLPFFTCLLPSFLLHIPASVFTGLVFQSLLRYSSRICLGPAFCLHHTLHLNILSFPKISATLLTNSRLLVTPDLSIEHQT